MNRYAKEEKSKRKTYKGQGRQLQARILLLYKYSTYIEG